MSKAQDPFAPTTDPALYVPRHATEQALEELIEASVKGTHLSLLLGETGMGKSLLLRVLARRAEADLHCIHVPVPTLDPEGVTLWISTRLPGGRRPAGTEALLEVANERPLLLLVEDAELLPAESAQTLAELHRASSGAIRAILAVNDSECPEHLALAFDPGAERVALADAMTRDEVSDYISRRLAAAGVPQSVAEHFGSSAIVQIHESSRGVPAQVNHAARRLMSSAARSLTPTLPETGLWQDPEPPLAPEDDLAFEPVAARRSRASWRRGRGLGWGIAAGLVPFIAGISIGIWLRPTSPPDADAVAVEAPGDTDPTTAPTLPAAPVLPSDETIETAAPAGATADSAAPSAPPVLAPAVEPESIASLTPPRTPSASQASPEGSDPAAESTPSPGSATDIEDDASGTGQVAAAPPGGVDQTTTSNAAGENELRVFGEPELDAETPQRTGQTPTASPVRQRPGSSDVAALPGQGPGSGAAPPSFTPLPLSGETMATSPGASTANELFLDSEPPAFVEIDGRPVGATPIRVGGLRPGSHRIVAHFETGETMTREVYIGSERSEVMLRGPLRRAPVPPGNGAGIFEP